MGDNENRELEDYAQEVSEISINSILPDDLLEQILVYLPIASIKRADLVCKKWHEITSSKRFLWKAVSLVWAAVDNKLLQIIERRNNI